MRKFRINVNGKAYDVEVEEIKDGAAAVSAPAPAPAAPKAAAPAPAPAPKAAPAAPVARQELALYQLRCLEQY
ncbi:MAG: hypothetical protein K0R84_2549 [Clostridia bacterium]|nr:hypothetical protein [Clostridia bacterium]